MVLCVKCSPALLCAQGYPRARGPVTEHAVLAQDDSFNMEQVSPGDLGGLTAQNLKLREALEACRGQLSSMNEQVLPAALCFRPRSTK